MTISNQNRVATFVGNGAATVFPFTFPVYESSHLEVRLYVIATGTFVTLSASDYSVTGIGPESTGGSVTYNPSGVPIASTQLLAIYRTLPYTQDTDIVNQSGFYPAVIEAQLDRIVMQIQQIAEEVGRAVLIPPTSSITESELTALIIELGGMTEALATIAAWISGGLQIATLDITGFVFATAGQTSIPVLNGYIPGAIEIRRNGVVQLQGTPIGTGDTSFDCSALDGANILFPAAELDENDCISWTKKRNFDVAIVAAEAVTFVPTGGLSSSDVQAALAELDSEKVPGARQITTSGLLTGGGALTADRAFEVPKASAAECITGTEDAKAATPLGVKAALVAYGSTPAQALITSGTTTAMAQLDLEFTGGFDAYELVLQKFEPVTAAQSLLLRLAFDATPTFLTGTGYNLAGLYTTSADSIFHSWSGVAANAFTITRTQNVQGGNTSMQTIRFALNGTGSYSTISVDSTYKVSTAVENIRAGGDNTANNARPTWLRLIYGSGNIGAGGKYKLYGLRS